MRTNASAKRAIRATAPTTAIPAMRPVVFEVEDTVGTDDEEFVVALAAEPLASLVVVPVCIADELLNDEGLDPALVAPDTEDVDKAG